MCASDEFLTVDNILFIKLIFEPQDWQTGGVAALFRTGCGYVGELNCISIEDVLIKFVFLIFFF